MIRFIVISAAVCLSSCMRDHDCLCVTTDVTTNQVANQTYEYRTTYDRAKVMCEKHNDEVGTVTTNCSLQ